LILGLVAPLLAISYNQIIYFTMYVSAVQYSTVDRLAECCSMLGLGLP